MLAVRPQGKLRCIQDSQEAIFGKTLWKVRRTAAVGTADGASLACRGTCWLEASQVKLPGLHDPVAAREWLFGL